MSSPHLLASSPTRGLLSQWWKNFKNGEDSAGSAKDRPPLLASRSSSAVLTTQNRMSTPPVPEEDELIVRNNGKSVRIPAEYADSPIFGVPLEESIKYASSQIKLRDSHDKEFVYGQLPVVVAKCGLFLKQNGVKVRGIFRLSGSSRRINVLQQIFNTPPSFGKDVQWDGFNVHDAATVLRRYFNQLPEPIVPHKSYQSFRDPMDQCPEVRDWMSYKGEVLMNVGDHSDLKEVPKPEQKVIDNLVEQYIEQLFKLPPPNLHLFVYLLDVMDLFVANAEDNLMPAFNLATIFLYSMLYHPKDDDVMQAKEYPLSRLVLAFLIENSHAILARVQLLAVEAHERKLATQPPRAEPAASPAPPSANSSRTSLAPSAARSSTDQGGDKPMLVVDSDSDPVVRRVHSKSLSSANAPRRRSFMQTIKRQMSTSRRRDSSIYGQPNSSQASLTSTTSPGSLNLNAPVNLNKK